MACKRTIVKAKLTSQKILATGAIIPFDTIVAQGCSASASGNTGIVLKGEGTYLIEFNATATEGGTAGLLTVQLERDGVAVPGVLASATSTAATDYEDFAFSEIIDLKRSCLCADNSTVLTVANTGTGATFTNAYLKVVKL